MSTTSTLTVEEDSVRLETDRIDGGYIQFTATGGPEDDVSVRITVKGTSISCTLTSDQRDKLQTALLNFGNTGRFNREM